MPTKKPLPVVVPDRVRRPPRSFASIDHRLRSSGRLAMLDPPEIGLYLFLVLAADKDGLSCWRLDRIEREMPCFRRQADRGLRRSAGRRHGQGEPSARPEPESAQVLCRPGLGTHAATKDFVARHGKAALYLRHVTPICEALRRRGVRPLLWDDMMRTWDPEELGALGANADLVVWGYEGDPSADSRYCETLARYQAQGIKLWGATAYKGGDGMNGDVPRIEPREVNAAGWTESAPSAARLDGSMCLQRMPK